ncbi:DUF3494 domain-containing protein, partial [Nonomuraea sp. RK-328]|nr:DUF3494 domain-containing protein [Nonomuraea sp. RK-328]
MMTRLSSSWMAAAVAGVLAVSTFHATSRGATTRLQPRVDLGEAEECAAMAGTRVVNEDLTTVTGDLVVTPGDTVIGFPPGEVRGEIYIDDPSARAMRQDAIAAYQDAEGEAPNGEISPQLGGKVLPPGVYRSTDGSFRINGTLTLDAKGDPDAFFIFQTETDLTTARVSNVDLRNGAQANRIIWQVADDASLGRYSTFRGNVLAWSSVNVAYGAAVYGRTMALHDSLVFEGTEVEPTTRVTLPDNPPTVTSLTSGPNPARREEPVTFTAKVGGNVQGFRPTGTVLFMEGTTVIGSAYADETGIARFTTSSLTRGIHEIHAVYVDEGTAVFEAWVEFAPSESPVVTQQVLDRR